MNKELINQSVSVTLPDSFTPMTEAELCRVFQNNDPGRWGARDQENHIMLTVMWKNYPPLLSKLAGLKSVCAKNEQLNARGYAGHGYQCGGFFSREVDGFPAEGYSFSYRVGDILQSAETVLFKLDKAVWSVTCVGRAENRSADHETFSEILDGIRFE